jgi:dihydroneopterin aldolase
MTTPTGRRWLIEMTKMLASVADAREAAIAAEGGADILDVEFADLQEGGHDLAGELRRLARKGNARRSLWVAFGDWPEKEGALASMLPVAASAGADAIRVSAPPPHAERPSVKTELSGAPVPVIAVLHADRDPDPVTLHALFDQGFSGVFIDLPENARGRLLDYLSPSRLAEFVARCRALGLTIGLAGALEAPDIPRLLSLGPDVLGFRAALLDGGTNRQTGRSETMRAVRSLIPADSVPVGNGRRAIAKGHALPTDKIFVHDFVLPVEIGAYRHEHGQAQKVRFDVTALVERMPGVPRDMKDIVSYDLILDGIRTIVGGGHVMLAETLAEEVAALVLRHPRVVRVMVRVHKLELGPGGVGVEIEREKADYPIP